MHELTDSNVSPDKLLNFKIFKIKNCRIAHANIHESSSSLVILAFVHSVRAGSRSSARSARLIHNTCKYLYRILMETIYRCLVRSLALVYLSVSRWSPGRALSNETRRGPGDTGSDARCALNLLPRITSSAAPHDNDEVDKVKHAPLVIGEH